MWDVDIRERVRQRVRDGWSVACAADALAIPRSTAYRWISRIHPTDDCPPQQCFVCDKSELSDPDRCAYLYTLGQYLGDGHLVTTAHVPVLRIYACTDYPEVLTLIGQAVETVRGTIPGTVRSSISPRMVTVQSYWMHWPCVLPQHGPGRKHERRIELLDWQHQLVERDPWPLIRGLIHSDGCRATNRVTVRGVSYAYPRYFFSNESADILSIMGHALDLAGVAWRYNRPNCISVARRTAVEAMDARVGPKS